MFKKNKKEEIKQEEQTIETKPIEDNGSLFGINLDAMPSDDFGSNNSNKSRRELSFFKKHRKQLIVSLASIFIVLSIFLVIYFIRISQAVKICQDLIAQSFYSETALKEELISKGYNDLEINSAIRRCKINFDDNIKKELNKIIESPQELYSKNALIKKLSEKGFSDAEIERAFLLIKWEDFLKDYITNYINTLDSLTNKKSIMKKVKEAGFDDKDILYISSLQIWNDLGRNYIEKYFSDNKEATKADVKEYLASLGFDDEEIDDIFVNIDWNNQALLCITNYIDNLKNPKDDDKDKIDKNKKDIKITKALFEKKLKEMGFTDDEIKYAIDNYDFSLVLQDDFKEIVDKQDKIISRKDIEKGLKDLDYTDEEIKEFLDKMNWKDYAFSTCAQLLSTNKANKKDALDFLANNGYSDDEIKYAEEKTAWGNYVSKALAYMLDGNSKTMDGLIQTLKDYGYTEDEIILAKTNTNFNRYAYNYLTSTVSTSKLSSISKTEINDILSKAGYGDDYNYVIDKFDWDKQALNYLSPLISDCLKNLSTYDYSSIVSDMQNKGFTENRNISNAFDSYDFATFTSEWVNKYINEPSRAPSKNELIDKLSGMKTSNSTSLYDDYGSLIDFDDCAKKAAEYYKGTGQNKEETEESMKNSGFSDLEIEYGINEAFD